MISITEIVMNSMETVEKDVTDIENDSGHATDTDNESEHNDVDKVTENSTEEEAYTKDLGKYLQIFLKVWKLM